MIKSAATRRCSIQPEGSDRLIMTVPEHATSQQKALWFKAWYRAQLRDRASPRVAKWAERLGVPTPRWGIKLMRTKWGSCIPEKGIVWLNLHLVQKPLVSLDYLILHELAHLIAPRHDGVFVGIMDRNMPGWRQIRADLNALPLLA